MTSSNSTSLADGSLRARQARLRSTSLGKRAFTLLEVLAAVAILGLVYIVLARSNVLALRAVGEADRRLHASLLADATLAELETQLALGAAPQPGELSSQQDGFAIEIAVRPFEFPFPEEESATPGGRSAEDSADGLILLAARGRVVPPLRQIAIRVSWIEGVQEQSVSRTSFAYDRAAALEVVERFAPVSATEPEEEPEP